VSGALDKKVSTTEKSIVVAGLESGTWYFDVFAYKGLIASPTSGEVSLIIEGDVTEILIKNFKITIIVEGNTP